MTKSNLDPMQVAALKTATALLIANVGGLVAAATVCRVDVARLSDYQNRAHPGSMMPIDIVLQIQAYTVDPFVTAAMARIVGLSLVAPIVGNAATLAHSVAEVVRGAGALGGTYMDAAADGVVDARETMALREQLERVRDAAEAGLAGLAPSDSVVLPLRACS